MRIKSLVFMILFTSVVLIPQIPITTAELQRYPDIRVEFKPYGWGEVEQRINKITVGQRLVLEVKIRNTGEDSITLDSSGVRLGIYVEGPRGFEEAKHWPPYRLWEDLYLLPKTTTIFYVPLDELLWDRQQIPAEAEGKGWKIYLTLERNTKPEPLVYGTPNPLEFEVAREITFSDKVNAFWLEITMFGIGITILLSVITQRKKIFPWRIKLRVTREKSRLIENESENWNKYTVVS